MGREIKTVREHLKGALTPKEFIQAMDNVRAQEKEVSMDIKCSTPYSALMGAFNFEESNQGFRYWLIIANRLQDKRYDAVDNHG
jgi:hypothetical protein